MGTPHEHCSLRSTIAVAHSVYPKKIIPLSFSASVRQNALHHQSPPAGVWVVVVHCGQLLNPSGPSSGGVNQSWHYVVFNCSTPHFWSVLKVKFFVCSLRLGVKRGMVVVTCVIQSVFINQDLVDLVMF